MEYDPFIVEFIISVLRKAQKWLKMAKMAILSHFGAFHRTEMINSMIKGSYSMVQIYKSS